MTAIDRLRAANRYPMKLANGIPLEFRLPFLEEMIVARVLPLSILDEVRKRILDAQERKEEGATPAETEAAIAEAESFVEASMAERLEKYETDFEAKQRLVSMMVTTLDGEQVAMTPAETLELPPENWRQLVAIGIRQEPPRAEGEE